jgi:hypothetical protein
MRPKGRPGRAPRRLGSTADAVERGGVALPDAASRKPNPERDAGSTRSARQRRVASRCSSSQAIASRASHETTAAGRKRHPTLSTAALLLGIGGAARRRRHPRAAALAAAAARGADPSPNARSARSDKSTGACRFARSDQTSGRFIGRPPATNVAAASADATPQREAHWWTAAPLDWGRR